MRVPLFLVFLCAATVSAQQPAPAPVTVFGSVTVHVVCADTNQPARLASVTLQPADGIIPPANYAIPAKAGAVPPPQVTTYKTGLDGSVLIPGIAPGRYYVVVKQSGYLSLLAEFTREEINHPDEETKARIDKTIPVVVVAARMGSTVNVRLIHGATISGTLRFDDGAPVTVALVSLERRGKTGDWVSLGYEIYGNVDDQGHYRIGGLPAGEYRLHAQIELATRTAGNIFEVAFVSGTRYALTFYSGDGIRAADAKTFKVGEGENSTNNDITIPVARLHSVSGTLVDAASGAILNSGRIALFPGDDKNPIAIVRVDDDSTFRFDFILEGVYTLKVSQARMVRRDDIVPAQGAAFNAYAPKFKEVPLKTYGDYETPFTVQTDMTAVTLPMPESKPKAAK